MKKRLLLALAAALTLSFAACGNDAASESADATADAVAEGITYNALDYVTLGDYKNIELSVNKYMVYDSDVEEYVNMIVENSTFHAEVADRTVVESGDYINVAYQLLVDGEEKDSGDSMEFTVGNGEMIEDFDNAMIGAVVGEEFTFEATFPEGYSDELSNVTGTFTVTVNKLMEGELTTPDLTDEWVDENYGTSMDVHTVDELSQSVREYLQAQADENSENELLTAIQEAVYAACTVNSLPDGLLAETVEEKVESDKATAESYGYSFEDYLYQAYGFSTEDEYRAELEKEATEYLEQQLIREAIIANEGWVADDELIDKFLVYFASIYGYDSLDAFIEVYGASNGFSNKEEFIETVGYDAIEQAALSMKIWDVVEESATINYIVQEDDAVSASGDASAEETTEE